MFSWISYYFIYRRKTHWFSRAHAQTRIRIKFSLFSRPWWEKQIGSELISVLRTTTAKKAFLGPATRSFFVCVGGRVYSFFFRRLWPFPVTFFLFVHTKNMTLSVNSGPSCVHTIFVSRTIINWLVTKIYPQWKRNQQQLRTRTRSQRERRKINPWVLFPLPCATNNYL